MYNYKVIGKRIKEERKTLNLTQKEIAQRAGIDFRFLGNIERGVSKPSLATIVKISRALDMPLNILTAEEGTVIHKNPPENSAIVKEIARLIYMMEYFDALRVLQLVRYSIELFTGKKVSIPNEIQSNLKDDRVIIKNFKKEREKQSSKPKQKKHKGLSKFWEENIPLNSEEKPKKLKPKRAKKNFWLV